MDKKPLLALAGVIVAAMTAEFNDQVSSIALIDIRGALGIGHDPGTWIESLYVSGMVVGMAIAPSWAAAVTLRRFVFFVIALDCASSVLIPFSPDIEILYGLRILQGMSQGLTIPLLMTAALRFLTPDIRLYGLACYALTATFFPSLSAGVAALWTDSVDWRFIFFETIPLCALAAVLVWHGMPQDPPQYQRLRHYDKRGTLLVVIGLGALTTMLAHGNRLDWFHSPLICTLALISVVAIPLLVVNEWFHPMPLFGLKLLRRRNFAYGVFTLFCFITLGTSASTVPMAYLTEVQGYRPLQSCTIVMEIAGLQLIFLPLVAYILNFKWMDSRWVNGFGLLCVLTACIGCSQLTYGWNREQFYFWQAISGIGQACIVVSLLMMATNSVSPPEGPMASSMVNMPRAISEALGACLLELVAHFRGQLHSTRLLERAGENRFGIIQGPVVDPRHVPPLLPNGAPRSPESLLAFHDSLTVQQAVLVTSDQYLLLAGLAGLMLLVLLILPTRTYPPRIALARPAPPASAR